MKKIITGMVVLIVSAVSLAAAAQAQNNYD
jgi:hypothetical protein